MNTFEKIIEFIKNNRLLSFVVLLAVYIFITVLLTGPGFRLTNTSPSEDVSEIDYQLIKETNSFEYFIMNGKHYVSIKDLSKTNEETIKNTLGISNNISIILLYPNEYYDMLDYDAEINQLPNKNY
jgi:hypothetical protein